MFKRLFAILILCLVSLTFIGPTYASSVSQYFSDTETSTGNTFSATTLDFSLRDTSNVVLSSPLLNAAAWIPGSSETKTVRVKKDGLADFKYQLTATRTGGDAGLCTALQVEAKFGGTMYSGGLLGLTITPQTIGGAGQDDWNIKVSLSDGFSALKNKTCSFDLTYKSWQTNSDGTWGFSSSKTLSNTITTGTWVSSSDIVINEIMWMGSSGNDSDEWIELRNTTSNPIDLSNWQITSLVGASNTETLMLTIPSGKTISANGYFLIAHFNKDTSAINVEPDLVDTHVVLRNSDLQIKLYKGTWTNSSNLIDIADDGNGTPLAGVNSTNKQSMERNNDLAGWHICTDSACNDTTYWDTEGNNYGTPKAANLSQNDPSSQDYVLPVVTIPEPEPTSPEPPASSSATIVEPTPPATPSGEIIP